MGGRELFHILITGCSKDGDAHPVQVLAQIQGRLLLGELAPEPPQTTNSVLRVESHGRRIHGRMGMHGMGHCIQSGLEQMDPSRSISAPLWTPARDRRRDGTMVLSSHLPR